MMCTAFSLRLRLWSDLRGKCKGCQNSSKIQRLLPLFAEDQLGSRIFLRLHRDDPLSPSSIFGGTQRSRHADIPGSSR